MVSGARAAYRFPGQIQNEKIIVIGWQGDLWMRGEDVWQVQRKRR